MKRRWFFLFSVLLLICCTMTVCHTIAENAGETQQTEILPIGSWAFNYAPDQVVLQINADGTAVMQGQSLSWEVQFPFLSLKAADGQTNTIRFNMVRGQLILYLPSVYERVSQGEWQGITGTWKGSGNSGSTFVFTEEGSFLEDSTFTGTYSVDDEKGTLTLEYVDGVFQDTTCYIEQNGNTLTVVYPWPMVNP